METLTPQWQDYELVDSGEAKKLERFGEFTLIRPEPQATWKRALDADFWDTAHAEFVRSDSKSGPRGEWKCRRPIPPRWKMKRKALKFWVQPAPSGHVGVFPDQAVHWDWIAQVLGRRAQTTPAKVLSLFGHTGLASLAAASAGAAVTHVDASRKAIALARENQQLSELGDRPIRWVVEDAVRFVAREARRGNRYDALILDPPRFGRGPSGELWKLDESLPQLLGACARLLSESPLFALLNVYTTVVTGKHANAEAEKLRAYVRQMLGNARAKITWGELALEDRAHRRISTSVFARWF